MSALHSFLQEIYSFSRKNAKKMLQFIITCVAEGESGSRSAVTPSVCSSVCLSDRPSQNLVIATPLKLLI